MSQERRDRRALLQGAVTHRIVINRTEKLRDVPPTIGDEAVNHGPSIRDDRSSGANLARHVGLMWGGFEALPVLAPRSRTGCSWSRWTTWRTRAAESARR